MPISPLETEAEERSVLHITPGCMREHPGARVPPPCAAIDFISEKARLAVLGSATNGDGLASSERCGRWLACMILESHPHSIVLKP